eukprot:8956550-Karenia_brevis.AAC.1
MKSHFGVISRIFPIIRRWGWSWRSPWVFRTRNGREINMLQLDAKAWQHELREAQRQTLWKAAAKRRKDMQGIGNGVERAPTMSLAGSLKKTADGGILRGILAGAVWTDHRLFKAKLLPVDCCRLCSDNVAGTERHMYWKCKAFEGIRRKYAVA